VYRILLGRYENTERRSKLVAEKGLLYMGMGVSGGEEGARNGAQLPVAKT
jgi:6-phosphogluconate dehydrogenase